MLPIIPKNTLILFSSGEYSDYSVYGLCRAVEDINVAELRNEYINCFPEETSKYSFKEDNFIKFIKEKKIVENIPFSEWYLASYSSISDMRVTTKGPMIFT